MSPPSKTIFRSKSTPDSVKSAFRRKPSLGPPVYKVPTDLTVERQHASLTDIALLVDARISEEKLEKYQDLKRELKRIWKCKEALGAL